uniref:DUF2996 domain-containing protein n=1 Tax=Panagrellus redivivus TaxID=6233 RepID=A0A7E4UQK6_PANRE
MIRRSLSTSTRLASRASSAFSRPRRTQIPLIESPFPSLIPSTTAGSRRAFSVEAPTESNMPRKESLLTIDWILEGMVPAFMKAPLQPIFERMIPDVEYVDDIYGYKARGIDDLGLHVTKVRTYFRYKSPYNRPSHNGSYLFDDDNYIVVLWGLETIDSDIYTYLPAFVTGRENRPRIIEGALKFTVNGEGKITKIHNRPITEADRKLAAEFGDLKQQQTEQFDKEDRKAAEKALKDQLEQEREDDARARP